MSNLPKLPDVQSRKVKSGLGIDKVGIKGLCLPLKVLMRDDTIQDTIAEVTTASSLGKTARGVNMSRFAEVLHSFVDQGLSREFMINAVRELKSRMKSKAIYLKVKFPFFIKKKAPISQKEGYTQYDCMMEASLQKKKVKHFFTTKVQYISTCPCSSELSDHLKKTKKQGAYPHMQRSFATVTIEYDFPGAVYVEDLVDLIEESVVTIPYPIIKRPDEQEVARLCFENTQFCEDAMRSIAGRLKKISVKDWVVIVDHEESIHQHNAFAVTAKGKQGGLR